MEQRAYYTYKTISVFLLGFMVKTALIYVLFYAAKEGTVLENIARSFIFSFIIDVVGWPLMWLLESMKKRKEKLTT